MTAAPKRRTGALKRARQPKEPKESKGSKRRGRIITFYSYKGGTGRSMAVANAAWILASHGRRVLVIDWDFEAPGLHRYFHPFLEDPDLVSSPGLIDFLVEFAQAGGAQARATAAAVAETTSGAPAAEAPKADEWWRSRTSLLRFTYPLQDPLLESTDSKPVAGEHFGSERSKRGVIHFVPAGRQGPEYGLRVSRFDWNRFYDHLGGGVFLEAVKQELRDEYDFVLIDSRTGISDTAGICTVQMPDDLVVCFTFNQQSMQGAASVAAAADAQRSKPTGGSGVRIWPVPMRVELDERDRLERARVEARRLFHHFLRLEWRKDLDLYWGSVEVLYQPYFAYEEVLAVFAERPLVSSSMLASYEKLVGFITQNLRAPVNRMASLSERSRHRVLEKFLRGSKPTASAKRKHVVVAFGNGMKTFAARIRADLETRRVETWWEGDLLPGDDWRKETESVIRSAAATVVVVGTGGLSASSMLAVETGKKSGVRMLPVVMGNAKVLDRYKSLRSLHPLQIGASGKPTAQEVRGVADQIVRVTGQASSGDVPVDPNDPHKGQWGGSPDRDERHLSASVQSAGDDWFEVTLLVVGSAKSPLTGEVTFHLHPSYPSPEVRVEAEAGIARLIVGAWGAFTVGIECDGGATRLELDLAALKKAPKKFRDR